MQDNDLTEVGILQEKAQKAKDIFAAYHKSKYSKTYLAEHEQAITARRTAKKHFNELNLEKLPTINQLKQEYATLAAEKKKLYSGYHELKANSRALSVAKGNADRILGITSDTQNREAAHEPRRNFREI